MNFETAKINYLAIIATMISGAAIPISTAIQNIGAALLIIAFIQTSNTRSQITNIFLKPFPLAGLFFGVVLVLGISWSSANPSTAWGFVLKMRAYYLAPIFLTVLAAGKVQRYFLISFAAMTLITVILSCASALFNYPIFMAVQGDWFIFRTHTYHNFFAALLGTGILAILISKQIPKKLQILLIVILICISYNILFLVAGRTGQIAYIFMLGLVLLLWNWRLGIVLGLALIAALALVLPNYSPAFSSGLKSAEANLNSYSQGDANTSIGLRLEWQKNSIRLIQERPFLGHGTGSFKGEYERILGSQDKALMSQNPHNDYLWLGVELGVLGPLLLLSLLLAAAWQGRHLQNAWRWTLYALLLGMGISTTANSFFTDNITGLAFVLLTCALLSGPIIKGRPA